MLTPQQELDEMNRLEHHKRAFEEGLARAQKREAEKAAKAAEEAKSLAILTESVKGLVAMSQLTDPYQNQKVYKLALELDGSFVGYAGLVYDLLTSPVYGLEKVGGRLQWGYKAFKGLDQLRVEIDRLLPGSQRLSKPAFAALVTQISQNDPKWAPDAKRDRAVEKAAIFQNDPVMPDGLTLTDQIRLANAMGIEPF